jgi:hypothetical protein
MMRPFLSFDFSFETRKEERTSWVSMQRWGPNLWMAVHHTPACEIIRSMRGEAFPTLLCHRLPPQWRSFRAQNTSRTCCAAHT